MRSLVAAACAASLLFLAACGGPASSESGDAPTTVDAAPGQGTPADGVSQTASDADLETIRIAVSGMG